MPENMRDDLEVLFAVLPPLVREALLRLDDREDILEIVLDLGRLPEARFPEREVVLSEQPITAEDLAYVVQRIGEFGDDNRAGIERTLHRISAIRNRKGVVVGLTCRVGRAVQGTVALIRDVIEQGRSILILGRPGVGKTTLLREAARVLADELGKRVVVVDTSNEIAGDGDIPHPGIGRARRMQVARTAEQHQVMIEAVENHMPEVIVIDEIGTEAEAQAARTIAERGVQLVGTAHGRTLDNLLVNPTLSDLVGGIQSVTLGDEEARRRGTQKTVLERKAPPTFDVLVEQQSWREAIIYREVAAAVDELLRGQAPAALQRVRDEDGNIHARVISTEPMGTTAWGGGRAGAGEPPSDIRSYGGGRRRERGDRGGRGAWAGQARDRGAAASMAPMARLMANPQREEPSEVPWPVLMEQAAEPADESYDLDEAEATGTTGVRSVGAARRKLRIYPYGISRERLEESARQLRVPVEISRDQQTADAVITLRTFYRRQAEQFHFAERERKPVYILRTNTVAQMQQCLSRIFDLQQSEDALASGGAGNPTMQAMQEAEDAAGHLVMAGHGQVELQPQNAYIRRQQHVIAERYNLASRSHGKEPNRRVRLLHP